MTTYTITVGSSGGFYGADDGTFIGVYGSISPGGDFSVFAWAGDGTLVYIVSTLPAGTNVTWNGHSYPLTDFGDGLAGYFGAGLGGPYPTSGTTTISAGGDGISGTLAATDPADSASFSGKASNTGALAATDAPDVFLAADGSSTSGVWASVEPPDVAALTGAVTNTGTLAASDPSDVASFNTGAATSQWGGHFPSIYISRKRRPRENPRDAVREALESAFSGLEPQPAPPMAPFFADDVLPPPDPIAEVIAAVAQAQLGAIRLADEDDEDAIMALVLT